MNRLFVYGTLRNRSNHPMQRFLAQHAEYLGVGTIHGELYDLGRYPGVWLPSEGSDRVVGDLYEIHDATAAEVWLSLDSYEMCGPNDPEPHLYRRQTLDVQLKTGTNTEATVYVLNSLPFHARKIANGDYTLEPNP